MEAIRRLFTRKNKFRAEPGAPSMRGLVYCKDGSMRMAEDLRIPSLTSTQVLVRVYCTSLNHEDYQRPRVPFMVKDSEPVGVEFVGVIEKLGWVAGDKVHMFPFAIGEVVFGMSFGTVAEFVVAEASKISYKLDGMADEQAAAFSVSGLTAFQSLKFNKFEAGQTLMVIGAEDGTGAMFIKQAKLSGAGKVIGVVVNASAEGAVEESGADEVVPLSGFDALLPECDLVVDLVSDPALTREEGAPDLYELSKPHLKAGARFVALNAGRVDLVRKLISESVGFNLQRAGFDAALVRPRTAELGQLAEWAEAGQLTQEIDSVLPFEEAALLEGYARLKAHEVTGKVVVRVAHPEY